MINIKQTKLVSDCRGISMTEYAIALSILFIIMLTAGIMLRNSAEYRANVSQDVVKGFTPCGPESFLENSECF